MPSQADKTFWCPLTVAQIERQFSKSTADILFRLPRKKPPLRDHSKCDMECDAHRIDWNECNLTHWIKHPKSVVCKPSGPKWDELEDIVDKGGIPLISLRFSAAGDPDIQVVRATRSSRYFAVSHVWSGGIGNAKENKLVSCQLKRLFDIGKEFQHEEGKLRARKQPTRAHRCLTRLAIWSNTIYNKRKAPVCSGWTPSASQ